MVRPGVYEHFKGKQYRVIGTALHSETGEDMVVYEALYPCDHPLWVRPAAMFEELVEKADGSRPRFTFLHD